MKRKSASDNGHDRNGYGRLEEALSQLSSSQSQLSLSQMSLTQAQANLTQAHATLAQTQATFLARISDTDRENAQRFARIEENIAKIFRTLDEHSHMLEALTLSM